LSFTTSLALSPTGNTLVLEFNTASWDTSLIYGTSSTVTHD